MLKRFFALLSMMLLAATMALPSMAATVPQVNKHGVKGLSCMMCHKETPPAIAAPQTTCVNCHGDNEAMAKRTEKVFPNPHYNHLGDMECTECHKNHAPSTLICNDCHKFNLQTP